MSSPWTSGLLRRNQPQANEGDAPDEDSLNVEEELEDAREEEEAEPPLTPIQNLAARKVVLDTAGPRMKTSKRRSSMWNETAQRAAKQSQRRDLSPASASSEEGSTGGSVSSMDKVVIGGTELNVRRGEPQADSFKPAKLWDKTKRHSLKPEARQAFARGATGYVLAKSNKLSVPTTTTDAEGTLTHLHNLSSQLDQLRAHMENYDMDDVFQIVIPRNAWKSPRLQSNRTYNLFDDYAKLTPEMVSNSNVWYNHWIEDEYIKENMHLTFGCLQSNTEETLWNLALEDYKNSRFAQYPVQQGGPLMLRILLQRIQNVSETAIERLLEQLRALKISSLPGEDVDVAVSLINTTHGTLVSASTPDHCYVPDNFPCLVLDVLQTTSVPKFNEGIAYEQTRARHEADKFGGRPEWPSVEQITLLATNTYRRMVTNNEWHAPPGVKSSGFNAVKGPSTRGPPPNRQHNPKRGNAACFNCGDPDHLVYNCPKPRDEQRIVANMAKFTSKRSRDGSRRSSSKPH